jgi:transcriptional repressor NrdR
MRCPFCGNKEDKVVDSREGLNGAQVRRRRECLKCGRRFTTYEYKEEVPLMVVKKDGRREAFDRKKILSGLIKACEKRPISIEKLEEIALFVERSIQKKFEKEVPSDIVGELVMDRLAYLDDVAYVRFASVYRHFKDVSQFMRELNHLLGKNKGVIRKKKAKTRK